MPDGTYFLRVRGIDANRLEGRDAQIPFSIKAGTPPPPLPLQPADSSSVLGDSVMLYWVPVRDVTSYRFEVDDVETFSHVLHSAQRTPSFRFQISGLRPGRYYWRLASNRPDGERGPWGPTLQFEIGGATPAAQTDLPQAK